MNRSRKWFLLSLLVPVILSISTGWVDQVQCQEKYPTRAIEIIVPFAPGASVDLVPRITAAYVNKQWGVPVNVINKPGGNTVPACLEVYRAAPDGYTLLSDSTPSSSLLQIVVKNLPVKVMDRTFIASITVVPVLIMVPSASPLKSMKELEAEAKRDPGSFTWTSLGGTGIHDFVARQFLKAIGVDVSKTKPVMSQGGAQATTLTAGGHVKMGLATTSGILAAFKAGTVRPLGITGKERHTDFPEVPTFKESGYPGVNGQSWTGLSGPPKMPSYIVDIWNKAFREMERDPEIITKLKNIGTVPLYENASAIRDHVMKDAEEVEKLFK